MPEGESRPRGGGLLDADAQRAGLGTVLRHQAAAHDAAARCARTMLPRHRKADGFRGHAAWRR